jgi:hypothetical protein
MVDNTWALVAHKYDFKLSLPPPTISCMLRLDYYLRHFLLISLVLGCSRKIPCSAWRVSPLSRNSSPVWTALSPSQACEHLFLKLMGHFVPENTCHLKCLQIILSVWDYQSSPPSPGHPAPFSPPTTPMHLLLQLHLVDCQHNILSQWLQDLL